MFPWPFGVVILVGTVLSLHSTLNRLSKPLRNDGVHRYVSDIVKFFVYKVILSGSSYNLGKMILANLGHCYQWGNVIVAKEIRIVSRLEIVKTLARAYNI